MSNETPIRRLPGEGWLVLIGGGEFTFGETVDADRRWMAKAEPGTVGFLPTASGSTEYGDFFTSYIREGFDRQVDVIPIYRPRDARRRKNLDRLEQAAALYLGAGVVDHLLETFLDEPALETLAQQLGRGAVVTAIGAAAQVCGTFARSIFGGEVVHGFGWLPGGVVEPNFDPAHDRRLRTLMEQPGVTWGVGLPAGAALLLGPERRVEVLGTAFLLEESEGDLVPIGASA